MERSSQTWNKPLELNRTGHEDVSQLFLESAERKNTSSQLAVKARCELRLWEEGVEQGTV